MENNAELINPNDFTTKKYLSEHLLLTRHLSTSDGLNVTLKFVDTINSKPKPLQVMFNIANFTVPIVTTNSIGLMSADDKQIIEEYKNNKSLYIKGYEMNYDENSVIIGKYNDDNDDNNNDTYITIVNATPLTAGVMSADDKKYVDEYAVNRNYFLQCAANGDITYQKNSVIIGSVIDTDIYADSAIFTQVEIMAADTTRAGCMSKDDKILLNSLDNLSKFEYSKFTKNFIITFKDKYFIGDVLTQNDIYSINHILNISIPSFSDSDYNDILSLLHNLLDYFNNLQNQTIDKNILKYIGCLSNIKFMINISGIYQMFYFQTIDNTGITFMNNNGRVLKVVLDTYEMKFQIKDY